jgi:glycosyltransferase involved in cell wall biosynthesis
LKKVLIISNDFPPMGLGSVQRIAKFIKYFPRYGWEPIVLTATPKFFYAKDEYLLNQVVSAGAKIYRTPARRSVNFLNDQRVTPLPNEKKRRFRRKLRQAFRITDSSPLARKWKKKALKKADEIFSQHKIDLIFSTAPPFVNFIIACKLKEKYQVPLIIDYRDSWTDNPFGFYPTPLHRFINTKLEEEVLRVSDKVIAVNRRIKEMLIEKYPTLTHEDIWIVPHAYDKEEIDSAVSWLPRTNKMRFTFTGTFTNLYNPRAFLDALDLLFSRKPELRKKIEASFVGVFSKQDLNMIRDSGLRESVNISGYINHFEYIKYLNSSNVLWLIVNKEKGSDMLSPVSLYEYIGVKKPILACVSDGVVKAALKKYEAVKICEPDDIEAIASSIYEYYEMFEKNNLPVANEDVVKSYDVNTLTSELVRHFEFLIDVTPQFVKKDVLEIG